MRKSSYLIPLCALPLSCAAPDDASEESDQIDAQDISVAGAALTASAIPSHLELSDTTIDGKDEQVYSSYGFVFRVGSDSAKAHGAVENHGNASISYAIDTGVRCVKPNGDDYTVRTSATKTVAAGVTSSLERRAGPGRHEHGLLSEWTDLDLRAVQGDEEVTSPGRGARLQ